MNILPDFPAGKALTAAVRRSGLFFTVAGAGKLHGQRLFADGGNAAEKISVSGAFLTKRLL